MTDAELLALGADEIDEDLDRYLWDWINMGDDRVCDDCERLASLPPATMTEWTTQRTEPGRGDTVCGDRCRCAMVPADLVSIFPDLKTEGKIIIDDGLLTGEISEVKAPYEVFGELDGLIAEYKASTGGKKLPPEYFRIASVRKRIVFLEEWLEANG